MAPTVALCLVLIVSLIGIVDCRPILRLNSSDDRLLVSDGIGDDQQPNLSCCPHQYGFLSCAENAAGYAFLAAVYQVLLVLGDMLIGSGSEVLFYIIGPEFDGILFRIFRVLPSMEKVMVDKWRISKCVIKVLVGTVMVTFMAGPLMANVINLSNAVTHNPSNFFIAFFAVPLAIDFRIIVAATFFPAATQKRKGKSSLVFSEIYGGVVMNNMVGLTTLLAVVYAKDLAWDFTAQVLTIIFACAIVGTHASLSKVYRLWTYIPTSVMYVHSAALFLLF